MPGHRLFLFGLAQALEQAHAATVGIEGIDVVDDDEVVAMPVELRVHAERGGVALDPAGFAVQYRPHRAALGQPPGANEDQQMEVPLGEGAEILLQPLVGGQMQDFVGLVPSAFPLYGHGVSPAVFNI